jgi:uncharacterized protein
MMRGGLWLCAARALLAGVVALGLVLTPCAAALAEVPVAPLKARVTDLTGTLTEAQRQALEARLAAFEQKKGSQIAVLMLPSTQPETIEQYSIRVAEAWKIGRKGTDDGLILVVAKDDHKLRIEVGRGLEGPIPDVIAKRVIREVIAPHFLNGDFNRGIGDGIAALTGLIEGEPLPPPKPQAFSSDTDLEGLLAPLLVATVILGALLSKLFGRMLGAAATAGIVGMAAWVVTSAVLAAALAAIVAFVVALVLGASGLRGGGWGSGGWGSGGWTGGGGGYSGGGGDFGGGGASGNW